MPVTILATSAELELGIPALREIGERSFRFSHHRPRLVIPPAERRRRRKCDQAYGPAIGQDQCFHL